MASKNKNTNQNMQRDDSNMELGEHQSGHIQDQQQGQQSGKSGGTMTQAHTSDQRKYQQGSQMSADEPAEGSRENVEDDLKRQNK